MDGVLTHAPWTGPPLAGVEWIVLGLLVAYLALGEPWLGERFFAGFRRANGEGERGRWFAGLVAMQAAALGVALLLVWGLPGMDASRSGLAWGRAPSGVALGMMAGAAVGMALGAVMARRGNSGGAGVAPVPVGDFQVLLPRNRRERGWLVAVSVGAGTSEELIYRGLLPALLVGAGVPLGWAVLAQGVLFGLAHRYQGPAGVMATTVVGLLMGVLAAHTGSLLLPALLHTAMDLKLAVAPVAEAPLAPGTGGSPMPPPAPDPDLTPPG